MTEKQRRHMIKLNLEYLFMTLSFILQVKVRAQMILAGACFLILKKRK